MGEAANIAQDPAPALTGLLADAAIAPHNHRMKRGERIYIWQAPSIASARTIDTALRDIQDLIEWGALRRTAGGGRSTGYEISD